MFDRRTWTEKNVLQEKLMIAYEDKQRQAVESDKLINEIKTEWNQKLEKANRLADARKRELESMVVKYAMSENQIIAAKNKKDEYEKKCRDALKDKDSLMMRIKGLSNEKVLLVTQIDQKSADLVSNAKEMDKYRLQMKEKDAQLIQATFSLQQEQEALRECKAKLQESEQTVEGLRNEIESLRQQTEIEVKTSDAVQRLEAQLLQERNAFQSKVTHLESENDLCLTKIQKLDQEKLSVHEQLDRNKRLVNKFQQDLEDYEQCKQTLVETRQALQRLQHDHDACREIVKRLEEDNVELQKEMDSCRQKEGELLEFTERLQSKTVNLQSEHILLQQKHSKETVELNELRAKCKHLEQSSKSLNDQLVEMAREAEQRKSEVENLKQQLEQHLQSQSKLKEELENENRVLRKRHVQNVKELNKELQGLRRKLEWTEADSSSQADASSICSRANSITSLEKTGVATSSTSNSNTLVSNGESVEENGLCLSNSTVITVSNSKAEADPIIQVDKQKLIQKIVSLQKMIVKKRERIEFLEEHNNQLTEEMKKKTRIIQNYILREEAGALTTNDMDTYKVKTKFQLNTINSKSIKGFTNNLFLLLDLCSGTIFASQHRNHVFVVQKHNVRFGNDSAVLA